MNLFDDVKRIRKAAEAARERLDLLAAAVDTQTALLAQIVGLLTPEPEPNPVVGLDVKPNPPVDR